MSAVATKKIEKTGSSQGMIQNMTLNQSEFEEKSRKARKTTDQRDPTNFPKIV
jgi:hypothetical protein